MDEIKTNLKSFNQSEWLVIIVVALAFWLVLDTVAGVLVGAPVGYLGVLWFRGQAERKRRDRDLGPPPSGD